AVRSWAGVGGGDSGMVLLVERRRDTMDRIRRWPEVALTFLAEGDVAFTARGRATVLEEPMAIDPEYAAVSIAVDHVDDHRQPAFRVTAGTEPPWGGEAAPRARPARRPPVTNATA